MTGKRTKRLLSLLLSVLLVAGMLPMGAMAKDLTPTDTNDYLDVKLMAGDIPGYATQSTCTDLIWWLGTQDGYTENTTDATELAANIEKANSIFKKASPVLEGSNKVADIEVDSDGYFYVALKLDGSNLSDGKGVGAVPGGAGFKFHVAYNQNAFELADMTLTGADPASQIATNPILSRSSGIAGNFNRIPAGTAKDSIANNYALSVEDMNKPFSCNGYTPTNGYGAALAISYLPASGNAYHVSSAAEWDCVFRFHVKDTATPGTYNFSYTETNDNSSITLLTTPNGASTATASDIIDFTNKTNADGIAAHVKHSDLKVKVANRSEGPKGEDSDYENKLANVKNLPYVSPKTDYVGDTDTLQFPDAENDGGFELGDTVVVYNGDPTEAATKELGRTTISASTLKEGWTDGETIGGKTLKLIDETKGDGWSYIKGERDVWIKRVQPGKDPSAKAVKITVTPEVVNYVEDTAALARDDGSELDGSSAAKPIKLHVGDSVTAVINKLVAGSVLIDDPATVRAPVESVLEGGAKVNAPLQYAWSSAELYNGAAGGMTQEGTNTEGVYVRHGHFVIRNPFADAMKSENAVLGEGETDTVVAEQPTVTYDSANYPIPTGGFGQLIYVNVVPNPSDYYLTNLGEGTKTQKLVVKGETNSKAKNNDLINLYKGEKPDNTVMGQAWPAAPGSNTQQIPRLDNLSADWSADPAPAEVWLSYQNSVNSTTDRYEESDRAKITVVTDATNPVVSGDVDVNSVSYLGAEIDIAGDDTLASIFDSVGDVEYEIIGPMSEAAPVPTRTLTLTSEQAKTIVGADYSNCDVAMTTKDNPVPVTGDAAKAALADGHAENALGTAFTISYTIPASANVPAPASDLPEYTNPSEYKVILQARVSAAISLSNDAVIKVTENKPFVPTDADMFDTIEITNDRNGSLYKALNKGNQVEIRIVDPNPAPDGTNVGSTNPENSTAVGAITPAIDTVNSTDNVTRYKYTVKVSQTARDIGTIRYLKILNSVGGAAGSGAISEGKLFTVDVQEEYAALEAVAPAPAQVQIKKEDLPDPYTAADVLARMDAMGTVSGPMVKYGYFGDSNTVIGSEAVFSANPFSGETGRWTTAEPTPDFEAGYVTFNMDMTKWVRPTTASDGLKINYITGGTETAKQWTAPTEMHIQAKVVNDKYDDDKNPKASEVLKLDNLKVVNNAYPADDVITVQDKADYKTGLDAVALGTTLTVDIYNKIGGVSTHIGKVTLTGEDAERPIVLDEGLDIKTVLDAMGGNVLFTVRTTDKEEEEAASNPVSVSYDVEPYTLWETSSILPDAISMRRTDVETGDASNATKTPLQRLKDRLAKTMTATAVHFSPTGVADAEPLTVSVENWLKADGTVLADTDYDTYFAANSTNSYQVKAQYAPAQAGSNKDGETGKFIRVTGNNGVVDAPLVVPTGTDTPDGYNVSNAVTVKLDADINAPDPNANPKTPTPDKASFVANGGNENDDNPSNDEIVISIAEATNKDALVGAHVVISYIDSEGVSHYETTTGTISGDINNDGTIDDNDYAITINKTTESWFDKGLALSGGTATYWFKLDDHEKSDSFTGTFEGQMAALKIIDDTTISTLTMSIGTVTTNDELLEYVIGRGEDKTGAITTAKALITGNIVVGLDTNFPNEVPLVKNGDTVVWKLEKKVSGNWTEVPTTTSTTVPPAEEGGESTTVTDNNNWATELAKDEAATIEYRLRADFDIDAYNTAHPGKTIQNGEDAELKVAFVALSLYNNLDPDNPNPLQLLEGNSDVYHHGSDALMPDGISANPAKAELDNRIAEAAAKGRTVTNETYKYDVILYYGSEKFEEQDPIYEAGVEVKPQDLVRYVQGNYVLKGETEAEDKVMYKGMYQINGQNVEEWIAEQEQDGTKEVTVQIDEIPLKKEYGTEDAKLYDVDVNYGTEEAPDMQTEKHIQPYINGAAVGSYFEEGVLGGTKRGNEYYKIVYTVTVKNKNGSGTPMVYTETRNVKLRYRPGDVDFSGAITSTDANRILERLGDKYLPFLEKELDEFGGQVKVDELEQQMMDVDGSGAITSTDANRILEYLGNKFSFLYQRF